MAEWLKIASDAFEASTSYIDANYRPKWDANIRAFHSKHPVGSKYLSDAFKHRSKGFRPKTRSIIRKNEAAAAVSFFSNMDVVSVDAVDQDDFLAVANSFVNKELIQHRLTKTIPWFKVLIGALQEAQKLGVVCSYDYWKYQSKESVVVQDEPCIELRPIENIRFDPAADWLDPVNSSPYFIDMIPMYVVDVKAMMDSDNDKTGEPKWLKVSDEDLSKSARADPDTTRLQREDNNQDRYDDEKPLGDFETVWVHRNFVRMPEGEVVYYTLGKEHLLSNPKPLKEVYPVYSGKRPYTLGICVIEAHRPLPDGVADLAQPLQTEANEIQNQRRDNVSLVLNKKYVARRGGQVDVDALVRNTPGQVILANDVNNDVREMEWNDVTASAYQEQNMVNTDLDELVGNFSGGSVQTNRQLNETVGGMKMLNQSASMMTEYLLTTFRETWVEPVLRHIMLLEQAYESDETVIALAVKKAKLFQRFGLSQVSDEMLKKELSLTINVGMGATNPDERLKKFLAATGAAYQMSMQAPPGADVKEIVKEIYSFAGFRDGARFFPEKVNPQIAKAMQIIQQLQGEVQGKDKELQAKMMTEQMKVQSDEKIKSAQIQVDSTRIQGDLAIRQAEIAIEQQRLELERIKLQIEAQGSSREQQMQSLEAGVTIRESQMKLEQEKMKLEGQAVKIAADIQKAQIDLQKAKFEQEAAKSEQETAKKDSEKVTQVAKSVTDSMSGVSKELQGMKSALDEIAQVKSDVKKLTDGFVGMAKQRKPKGFKFNKDGKKTKSVTVAYDDGSTEEMSVM
jgi:hypothetical protein